MPKRSSKGPRNPDENEIAYRVMLEATREPDEDQEQEPDPPPEQEPPTKNPAAVELGRLGGLKGGKARAEVLSKKRRSEIARKAARARWKKGKGGSA